MRTKRSTFFLAQNGLRSLAFLAFLAIAAFSFGQKTPTFFSKIDTAASPKITIELDIKHLIAKKNRGEYQPAHLKIGDQSVAWATEIRARGKFRRKTCVFPPIKIKIAKAQLFAAGLDTTHADFKIITHCTDDQRGDELLAREFLAYKLLEKLSPFAQRTRLVEVKYVDPTDKSLIINRLGIALEDDEELADRLGCRVVESIYNLPFDSLNIAAAANLVMFEYMVGNTDWSIKSYRNVLFFRPNDGGKYLVLPYDFDFSGLVNAPYAKPSSQSKRRKVRERFWMGEGLPPEAVRRAAKNFRRSENALLETVETFDRLPKSQREDMAGFVKSFFKDLGAMDDLPHN